MTKPFAPHNIESKYGYHADYPIWLDVDNDEYHEAGGVSSSDIRDIRDDIDFYLTGEKEEIVKDHLTLGQAFHDYYMRPNYFDEHYVVYPGKVRRGKKWEEFKENYSDMTILTSKMFGTIAQMRDNAGQCEVQDDIWIHERNPIFEVSAWVRDPHTGIMCKVRPDVYLPASKRVIDIKTASNPQWEGDGKYQKGFLFSIRKYGYYIQQAFYMDMLNYAGIPCERFGFYVFGTTPPHDVEYYELTNAFIKQGQEEYKEQLRRLKHKLIGG